MSANVADSEIQALNEQTVIDYVRNTPVYDLVLGGAGVYSAKAITEGNINLLFRVQNITSGQSVLVKQALPYSWRYPEFQLPVQRAEQVQRVPLAVRQGDASFTLAEEDRGVGGERRDWRWLGFW